GAGVGVGHVGTTDPRVASRVPGSGAPGRAKPPYSPTGPAGGGQGPGGATPTFMVVVPTSRDVRLEYSTTTAEYLGRAATAAGVVGVAGLAVWPWWWRRRRGRTDAAAGAPGDGGDPAPR